MFYILSRYFDDLHERIKLQLLEDLTVIDTQGNEC